MLSVEIANTPSKQSNGLMFRKSIPDDSGMLFSFISPGKLRFWGVNTFIPLDIAFVNQHNKITQISEIKPLSSDVIASDNLCHIAIEANLGWFAKNKIHVGDKISVDRSGPDSGIIEFKDSSIKKAQFIGTREDGSEGVQVDENTNLAKLQEAVQGWKRDQNQDQNLPTVSMEDLMNSLEDNYDDTEDKIQPELIDEPYYPDIKPDALPEEIIDSTEPEEVQVPEKEFPDFASAASALPWAAANKEVMHIWYTTKGGRDIERDIEPHGGFIAKTTGNAIVVTYDQTVGEIRAFIINNILYHQFIDKQFNPKFLVS